MARVQAAVDRTHGEQVLILRFVSTQQKGPVADPIRDPLEVVAVYFTAMTIEKADARMSGRKHFASEVLGSGERATIALATFTDPSTWPMAGDRLKRLERPGMPEQEVLTSYADETGRLTVLLTRPS